jgi:hypothetical protein
MLNNNGTLWTVSATRIPGTRSFAVATATNLRLRRTLAMNASRRQR